MYGTIQPNLGSQIVITGNNPYLKMLYHRTKNNLSTFEQKNAGFTPGHENLTAGRTTGSRTKASRP